MKDYTGVVSGRLTVVDCAGKDKWGSYRWNTVCECGTEKTVLGSNLKKTFSCGCWNVDSARKRFTKHGLRGHPIRNHHVAMMQRCYYEKSAGYNNYGGRGITVCAEWKSNLKGFYDWAINNGWEEGLAIDRIDNDKGYSPDNCRWATVQNNAYNKRAYNAGDVKYKGVSSIKDSAKFRAGIRHEGKQIHIGHFVDIEQAAKAYDTKAMELHGEFAWLNRDHFEEIN